MVFQQYYYERQMVVIIIDNKFAGTMKINFKLLLDLEIFFTFAGL